MDAKLDDWVVTPRIGKPVEINALWYNALRSLAGFARRLGHDDDADGYDALADQTAGRLRSRFWSDELGYCYDVLDGPDGDDPALRPNQLFAVSLPHSPLSEDQARAVVDVCAAPSADLARPAQPGARRSRVHRPLRRRPPQPRRGLSPGHDLGLAAGPLRQRALPGPPRPRPARSFLLPMLQHLHSHGVGSLSEIFDGDPPFTPRGCIAQAWTVAEVLRVWAEVKW